MSFSSSQWTIPELCVWIVTRSKDAINSLSSYSRTSLKFANAAHPGAYAARDEVIEKAQLGTLRITCLRSRSERTHYSQSDRVELTSEFWSNAEIADAGSWMSDGLWCVARRVGYPGATDHSGLMVESATARSLWQSPQDAKANDTGKLNHEAQLVLELARRMKAGEDRDRDTMRIWMRDEFGISRDDADALYKSTPDELRKAQMGRPPGKRKPEKSGQASKKTAEE
jgi:hypothetical protein